MSIVHFGYVNSEGEEKPQAPIDKGDDTCACACVCIENGLHKKTPFVSIV